MQGKYVGNNLFQLIMQQMSSNAFILASNVRAVSEFMAPWMATPMMTAALRFQDQNPTTLKIEGIRSLAALNPQFERIAGRFPDTINVQYGAGDAIKLSRDYTEVTMILNAEKPYRNLEAFGYAANLQSHAHPRASFEDIIDADNIETVLTGTDENLVRFEPKNNSGKRPVYLVAPRSGHYSTLVAPVIQNYLDAGIAVYVNDIICASESPKGENPHGMDQQVDDKTNGLKRVNELEDQSPDVVAICQGAIPMSIAIAKLCKDKSEFKPNSFAFLSGPGDVSITKSIVNEYGEGASIKNVERFGISTVPGLGKRVRAGHSQVGDFKSGNPGLHANDLTQIMNVIVQTGPKWAHASPPTQKEILAHLNSGDLTELEQDFLNKVLFRIEYETSADHDAQSFLDALILNFQQNFLAEGTATYHGEPVSLSDINIPVLTGDATRDDISTIGQSMGIHMHTSDKAIKSALIIPDKGHFWWGGTTAKTDQWPEIMKWQENPANSSIPEFNPSMIDDAKATHAANKKAEKEVVEAGKPFAIKISNWAGTVPLTMPMRFAA